MHFIFNLIYSCLQDSFKVEFVQFLDRGLWYISVYNDGDQAHDVIFSSRFTGNEFSELIFILNGKFYLWKPNFSYIICNLNNNESSMFVFVQICFVSGTYF